MEKKMIRNKYLKFNIFRYKEWLKQQRELNNVPIDDLLNSGTMLEYHGMSYESLWKQGLIILKEWCE